jgi:hypothetical protein
MTAGENLALRYFVTLTEALLKLKEIHQMSLHCANPVFDDPDLMLGFRSYLEICREDYEVVLEVCRLSLQPAKNEYLLHRLHRKLTPWGSPYCGPCQPKMWGRLTNAH